MRKMDNRDDLLRELKINHDDNVAVGVMVDNYKESFAKEMINGGGIEMIQSVKFNSQPTKLKKPFKVRYSDFKEKVKNKIYTVFGF